MLSPSFLQGTYSENQFLAVASAYQWNVQPSSADENIRQHIDFHISKGNTSYAVDVKGMKSISRRNAIVQDDWHVVEFIAVVYPAFKKSKYTPPFNPMNPDFSCGSGRAGWLYGNSDYIAFESKHHWVFVSPPALIQLCARTVDFTTTVPTPQQAQYAVYSRRDRGDLISYIHMEDLYAIRSALWRKSIIL